MVGIAAPETLLGARGLLGGIHRIQCPGDGGKVLTWQVRERRTKNWPRKRGTGRGPGGSAHACRNGERANGGTRKRCHLSRNHTACQCSSSLATLSLWCPGFAECERFDGPVRGNVLVGVLALRTLGREWILAANHTFSGSPHRLGLWDLGLLARWAGGPMGSMGEEACSCCP